MTRPADAELIVPAGPIFGDAYYSEVADKIFDFHIGFAKPIEGRRMYDAKFGSACGLYTNALVTAERIYLPRFGVPEDALALKQVRAATSREVVPVSSRQVCFMGGSVRCMSRQVCGKFASRPQAYFKISK